jgi:hypothetical protein
LHNQSKKSFAWDTIAYRRPHPLNQPHDKNVVEEDMRFIMMVSGRLLSPAVDGSKIQIRTLPRFGLVSHQTIYRNRPFSGSTTPKFSRAWAAMQEIEDWLTRLGLPDFAGAFAENGIDVSVLPHLTDQDLKDMGVLLGHRRKMLAAIAQLAGPFPAGPLFALTMSRWWSPCVERMVHGNKRGTTATQPKGALKKTSARPKAHSPITPQMMRSPAFPVGSLV